MQRDRSMPMLKKSKKKIKIDAPVNVSHYESPVNEFHLKFGKKNQIWTKRIDDFYVICLTLIVEVESKEGSRQGVQPLPVYILGMTDHPGLQNPLELGVGRRGG